MSVIWNETKALIKQLHVETGMHNLPSELQIPLMLQGITGFFQDSSRGQEVIQSLMGQALKPRNSNKHQHWNRSAQTQLTSMKTLLLFMLELGRFG